MSCFKWIVPYTLTIIILREQRAVDYWHWPKSLNVQVSAIPSFEFSFFAQVPNDMILLYVLAVIVFYISFSTGRQGVCGTRFIRPLIIRQPTIKFTPAFTTQKTFANDSHIIL